MHVCSARERNIVRIGTKVKVKGVGSRRSTHNRVLRRKVQQALRYALVALGMFVDNSVQFI